MSADTLAGWLARRLRSHRETGAVAVIVALVTSTVLLGMAAFTVDFGDTFARRASLDGVADEAARAGAQYLPNSTAAVTRRVDNLCADGNRDPSWDATVCPGAASRPGRWTEASRTGEIEVFMRGLQRQRPLR